MKSSVRECYAISREAERMVLSGVLVKYDLRKRKAKRVMEDVESIEISMDRQVCIVRWADASVRCGTQVMLVEDGDGLRALKAGYAPGDMGDEDDDGEDAEEEDDPDAPGIESGIIDIDGRITLSVRTALMLLTIFRYFEVYANAVSF